MCRVSGFVPKSGRRFGEKTVLTRKQNELLLFINKRLNEGGVSPSFDEMKEALRLKSKSGIHRLITGLEERGFLKRLAHRARALEVVRLPDDVSVRAPAKRDGPGFTPHVIPGRFRPLVGATPPQASAESDGSETTSIPLYGKIAAGTPIE